MTRVLLVTDGLMGGGSERQLALLAGSLPPTHQPSVLSLHDGPFKGVLEDAGISLEVLPRRHRFDVSPAIGMWASAQRFRPDVVHSWGWMSTAAMLPYCRATSTPLVDGTIRQGFLPPRRSGVRRLVLSQADRVVANSQAGLRAFGVPESRGRVVYNGFDESRLSPQWSSRESPGVGVPTTVVMAGRMVPAKDWTTLIEAARILAADTPHRWRFLALGSGPDRETLIESASDLVSAGIMEFPEAGLEALPIIAGADVGVLLTDARVAMEGCSNSIMEYMACSLPVVCTDRGGNPELVVNGRTGYLVPPSDAVAVSDALRRLRGSSARARSMGHAGRRRQLEMLSVQAMVDGWMSAYEWARRGTTGARE